MGELIHLSENSDKTNENENDSKETTFIENAPSSSSAAAMRMLTRQMSSDPKLEKKVTFARLLSKMSAEINSGTDYDVNLQQIFEPNNKKLICVLFFQG